MKVHSFIHSGHFYSTPSNPLLLRGAPDYSTDTVSEFHVEVHRQLQVKDLPKVHTWRLERESNPRTSVESHRLNQGATTSHVVASHYFQLLPSTRSTLLTGEPSASFRSLKTALFSLGLLHWKRF